MFNADCRNADNTRWLCEFINKLPAAAVHDDLDECLAEPKMRLWPRSWTLLAGATAYRCRTMGVDAPAWCDVPPLPEPWFVGMMTRFWAERTIRETPPEFARLNIYYPEIAICEGRELAEILAYRG